MWENIEVRSVEERMAFARENMMCIDLKICSSLVREEGG